MHGGGHTVFPGFGLSGQHIYLHKIRLTIEIACKYQGILKVIVCVTIWIIQYAPTVTLTLDPRND